MMVNNVAPYSSSPPRQRIDARPSSAQQIMYKGGENNRYAPSPEEYPELKVKAVFGGEAVVLYLPIPVTVDHFDSEIRSAWNVSPTAPCTMKWIDDEGVVASLIAPMVGLEALTSML